MAEISNQLIYEVLNSVQADIGQLDTRMQGVETRLQSMDGRLLALQTDVHHIYARIEDMDGRIKRVVKRLELSKPAL